MKIIRNYINNVKPNFVGEGKYQNGFLLFDAIENLFFSTGKKTKNPIHVRDAVDIQKVMVTVWLAAFPAMFFGMYNLGANSLEYLESIGQQNTGDWHHYFVSFVGYDSTSFFAKMWFGACYFIPIYIRFCCWYCLGGIICNCKKT
jgi:Na+-transporting NADH:ubiquinone oxidoreductase subunit B